MSVKDISPTERVLLGLIRRSPETYLGEHAGLEEFRQFLHGYEVALTRHRLHDVSILPEGFADYVERRFTGETGSGYGWWEFLAIAEPDNYAALESFWLILNEYLLVNELPLIVPPADRTPPAPHEDGLGRIGRRDVPRLAESYMRTFNGEPWWDKWNRNTALHRLDALCRTPGFAGYAAWKDGVPIGAVMGRTEYFSGGDCFQIVELWVEPRAQSKGYGMQLVHRLRMALRCRGVRKIFLIADPSALSGSICEACGFARHDGLCVLKLEENP